MTVAGEFVPRNVRNKEKSTLLCEKHELLALLPPQLPKSEMQEESMEEQPSLLYLQSKEMGAEALLGAVSLRLPLLW